MICRRIILRSRGTCCIRIGALFVVPEKDSLNFCAFPREAAKYNILDKQTAKMARSLARVGDEVLHEKPTDLRSARDVLIGVRGLVQQIYSGQGGY
jgi:hypothetical protein